MSSKLLGLLVLSAVLAGLSACYESPSVTVYEPGVYKGARDPLLAKLRDPAHQEKLQQRFKDVQGR
ncbi:MAG: hypothetical protein ACE5K1_02100 [Acidiferrobacterales bacterium]